MRDPERIPEILLVLEDYWKKNPDLRLCQIVSLVASFYQGRNQLSQTDDIFYVEDDDFLENLRLLSGDFPK